MKPNPDSMRKLGASVRDALGEVSPQQRARQRAHIIDPPIPAPRIERSTVIVWTAVAAAILLIVLGGTQLGSPAPHRLEATLVARPTIPPGATPASASPGAHAPEPVPTREPEPEAVALESGRLSVETGTPRTIHAGPYVITSGTDSKFNLSWDAIDEVLTLDVEEGNVGVVRAGAHHVVVAGDSFRSAASEVVVVHKSTSERADSAEQQRIRTPPPTWVRAANRGEYREALDLARASGVLDALRTLSRTELKHLADTTRLGGAPAKSETVLLELRRRFPRSKDARRAAFHLGRVFEGRARFDDAAAWYRTYLTSSPKGPFAAQARGRLLRVLSEHGNKAAAKTAAREYLEHHPKGAYAPLANRVAGNPAGAP